MKKSKLHVLIKEALTAGGWELDSQTSSYETFTRPTQRVEISVKPLRSDPEAYVFSFEDLKKHTKITSTDVISLLCSRLVKKIDID